MTTDQPTAADLLAMSDRARAAAESGLWAGVMLPGAFMPDGVAQATSEPKKPTGPLAQTEVTEEMIETGRDLLYAYDDSTEREEDFAVRLYVAMRARSHIAELEAEIARLRTTPPRLSATWEHQPDVTAPQPRPFPARALRFGSVAS